MLQCLLVDWQMSQVSGIQKLRESLKKKKKLRAEIAKRRSAFSTLEAALAGDQGGRQSSDC